MTTPGDAPIPKEVAGVRIRLYKTDKKIGSRCSGISVNGIDYRVGRGPDAHVPKLGEKFVASPQNVGLLLIIAEHFDHTDSEKKRVGVEALLDKMHELGRKLPKEADTLSQHTRDIFKGGPFFTSGRPGTLSWPSVTFEVILPGLGDKPPPLPQRPHNRRAATHLFGRDKEVLELERYLSLPAEERCAIVVSGGPGFGKSYLLDHVYLKHREGLFQKRQVIVPMPMQELPSADKLLEHVYSYLVSHWNIAHSGTDRWSILAHYLREKSVFVCIENIDTPQAVEVAAKVAVHLHGCIVVLEGRMAWEIADGNHLPLIELNELSRESSIELLQAETASRRFYEREDLDALAERLGDHPLALHIAAANLPDFKTVSDFLKRLDDNFEIEVQQSDFLRSLQQDRGAGNLAATFLLALKGLEQAFRDPAPRYLAGLAAMSFGPLDRMGDGLFRALSGLDDDFETLVHEARRRSLLNVQIRREYPTKQDKVIRIHPLLARILQVHIAPTYKLTQTIVEDRFERWLFTLLDDREYLPGSGLDADRWERWHQVYRERSALQWWLARAGTARVPELVRRAMGIALYLGPFDVWRSFAAKHIDKKDGDFTEPSETRSDLLWILSCAASHKGDIKEARSAIEEKRAVDLVKELHADELRRNAGLAIVGLVVAESLQVEGKLVESLEVREGLVTADVEACRGKFPYLDAIRLDGVADTCCRLALISSGDERAGYLARALEIRDAAYASYRGMSFSRGIACALSGRSDVYYLLGRHADAEKDIDQAIAMFDAIRELRWLPYTKLKKARVLLVRDRARYTNQAIAILYDALKGFEETGTIGFAKYALAWLASIHEKEGQTERADECREKLGEWQRRLPGPEEWERSGLGFEINPTII